jgi:SNF2 family DNA or RNA helicase
MRLDATVLSEHTWDMLVLDEAQTIKNPASRVTRAAYQIPATFRVALSGTPVENRLEDLWSQMHFANPGFLGDLGSFVEKYARPIESGNSVIAEKLRARIKPFVLRRRKQEVVPDLPPLTEVVRYVELSPDERLTYESILAVTRKEILEKLGAGGSVMAALEALLRLRQACCHPALIPGGQDGFSSKLQQIVETVTEATSEGHKVLIFSQWTSFLDRMEPAMETAGIEFLRLDGSTKDRATVVDSFQDPKGPKALLMSLKAGGVGINLTAADHVIIADPWWNPAAEEQAESRAHRIGQEHPVLVQRIVALGTVEERILALAEKKRALASSAMDGGAAMGLTRDDLIALLD